MWKQLKEEIAKADWPTFSKSERKILWGVIYFSTCGIALNVQWLYNLVSWLF